MIKLLMKLVKALTRCGCQPSRLGMTDATLGPWSCADACGNAPMMYGILSACDYRMPSGELVIGRGVTILLKDCITGNGYSSRWQDLSIPANDEPLIENADILECVPTLDDEDNIIAPGSLDIFRYDPEDPIPTQPWGTPRNTVVEELCGTPIADAGDFAKWYTDRTSSTFTLELETREGYRATWEAETDSCLTYVTLIQTTTDPEVAFLPRKLCVIPIESEPRKCCEDAESQCACNDPGVFCGDDCDDAKTINVTIGGCDGQIAFDGTLSSPRYWDATGWPAGITYPTPAPCGAFLYLASTGDECLNNLYLVLWCDGADYHLEAYCFDDDLETWVSQGEGDVDVVNECAGPRLAFTLPSLSCCCGGVQTECCENELPTTIIIDDGTNSGEATYSETLGGWLFPTSNFAGCTDTETATMIGPFLNCQEGIFSFSLAYEGSGDIPSVACNPAGTCEPFALSCMVTGCDNNVYTITLTPA